MMDEIYFFDLPVYRLSPQKYDLERESAIATERTRITQSAKCSIDDAMDQTIRRQRYNRYGDWHFNEVVAYIRLHFCGSQLRATYHTAEKKRNPISRHKVFTVRSKYMAYKLNLGSPSKATNSKIWETIQEFVQACRQLIRNRFIDDSALNRIGPYVDWLAVWQKN